MQADPFVNPAGTLAVFQANAGPRLIANDPYDPLPLVQPNLLVFTMNNSNLAGIDDVTADLVAANAVMTGIEIRISLAELGVPPNGQIRTPGSSRTAGTTSCRTRFWDRCRRGRELRESSLVDFSSVAGDQFLVLNFDCNGNGQQDHAEIAANPALDCFNPTSVSGPPFGRGGPDGKLDSCQCAANWDRNGSVNSGDVTAYLASWFADLGGTLPAGSANVNCDSSTTRATTAFRAVVRRAHHGNGCP